MRPFWLAGPLAVCLPCLAPFLLGALLTALGVGAIGSFFTDNALLLAIVIALGVVAALLVGPALKHRIKRLNRNRALVRSFPKE